MANDIKLSAVLELKDKFTSPTKKAQQSLQALDKSFSQAQSGATSATKTLAGTGTALEQVGAKAKKTGQAIKGIQSTKSILVNLKDNASSKISKVKSELAGIKKDHLITIKAKVIGGAKAVSGAASRLKEGASGLVGGMAMGAGAQMLGIAGIGVGVASVIDTYGKFEDQMKTVQAISMASASDYELLKNKAKEMGNATKFSATEAGQAFEYMAMAGWSTEQMLGGIEGIMSLSAASGQDLASTSDIVTDALTAFGMQAKDSGRFADVLAMASSKSNTNVGLMGETFKYVAPLAGALQYSAEDTAVAIGLMANAGIKGSQAGTALRTTLTRLAKPPKETADAMEALGLTITDSTGTMKPFREVMRDMRKSFAELTPAQKAQYAAAIGGQEAMSGLLAIVGAGDDVFAQLAKDIDNANGAAERMAKTRMDNLRGDIKLAQSAWESFVLEIMEGSASGGLRRLLQGATDTLNAFTENFRESGSAGEALFKTMKDGFMELSPGGKLITSAIAGIAAVKTAMKFKQGFDFLRGKGGKGSGPSGSGVNDMIVNAVNVTVNGGLSKGVPSPYNAPVPGSPTTKGGGIMGLLGKGAKFVGRNAGRLGLAAALGYSAYDIATANDKSSAFKRNAGGLGGMVVGAKAGAIAGGAIGSVIPGTGTAAGAVIGGLVGGAAGFIGGEALVENWTSITETVGTGIETLQTSLAGAWDSFDIGCASAMQSVIGFFTPAINLVVGIGAVVWDTIGSYWQAGVQWINDAVLAPLAEFASGAWNSITTTASEAWNGITQFASACLTSIQAFFTPLVSWFDSTIWQPASVLASAAGTAIEEGVNSAIAGIQGAWSGIVEWFETNIFSPISQKAQQIKEIASGIGGWVSNNVQYLQNRVSEFTGLPQKAVGSSFYSGGMTEINERGGEILDLPNGTRIYPHATTERMLQKELSGVGGGGATVSISGNTFVVREEADIDKIAYKIVTLFEQGALNHGGAY